MICSDVRRFRGLRSRAPDLLSGAVEPKNFRFTTRPIFSRQQTGDLKIDVTILGLVIGSDVPLWLYYDLALAINETDPAGSVYTRKSAGELQSVVPFGFNDDLAGIVIKSPPPSTLYSCESFRE